jgi:hypothetical protein
MVSLPKERRNGGACQLRVDVTFLARGKRLRALDSRAVHAAYNVPEACDSVAFVDTGSLTNGNG